MRNNLGCDVPLIGLTNGVRLFPISDSISDSNGNLNVFFAVENETNHCLGLIQPIESRAHDTTVRQPLPWARTIRP